MIIEAIEISLKILAVFVLFNEFFLQGVAGMIEYFMECHIGLKTTAIIVSPLFRCYVCMSSFWTIVFGWEFSWQMPLKILMVCGINYLINRLLHKWVE